MSKYKLELMGTEPLFIGSVSMAKYKITPTIENPGGDPAASIQIMSQDNVLSTQGAFDTSIETMGEATGHIFFLLSSRILNLSVKITSQTGTITEIQSISITNTNEFFTVSTTGDTENNPKPILLKTIVGTTQASDLVHAKTYKFMTTPPLPNGPWIHISASKGNLLSSANFTLINNSLLLKSVDTMNGNMVNIYIKTTPAGTAQVSISSEIPIWAILSSVMNAVGATPLGLVAYYNPTVIAPSLMLPIVLPPTIDLNDGTSSFQVTVPSNTMILKGSQVNIVLNDLSLGIDNITTNNEIFIKNYPKSNLLIGTNPQGLSNPIKYLVYKEGGIVILSPSFNILVLTPPLKITLQVVENNKNSDNIQHDVIKATLSIPVNGVDSPPTGTPLPTVEIIISDTSSSLDQATPVKSTSFKQVDVSGDAEFILFNGSGRDIDVQVTGTIINTDGTRGASTTVTAHFTAPKLNDVYTLTSNIDKNGAFSNNYDKDIITYTLRLNGQPPVDRKNLTVSFNHAGSNFIENDILIPSPLTRTTDGNGRLKVNIVNSGGNPAEFPVTCTLANATAGNPAPVTDTINFIASPSQMDVYHIEYATKNDVTATSNGTDQIDVTATLTKNGVISPFTNVTFTTSPDKDGIIVQARGTADPTKYLATTDANGKVTFQVISNVQLAKPYEIEGRLTSNNTNIDATVIRFSAPVKQVDKYVITLSANPTSGILANGSAQSIVTATLYKNGQPAPNENLTITVNGNALFPFNVRQSAQITTQPSTTSPAPGGNGAADIRVTNNANQNQTITVNCSLDRDPSVKATPITIGFIGTPAPADVYRIVLSAAPNSGVQANGSAQSIVTATLYKNGQPAPNENLTITVNGNASFPFNGRQSAQITTQPSTTSPAPGGNGAADIRVTNNANQNQTITVNCSLDRDPSVKAAPITIGFIGTPAPADVYRIVLSAAPNSGVQANGSAISVVTATVYKNNQLSPNENLTITVNGNAFFPFNNARSAPITTQPSSTSPAPGGNGAADIRIANNANQNQTITVNCSLNKNPSVTATPITIGFVGATVVQPVYTLYKRLLADGANIQIHPYPQQSGGACHIVFGLRDQNGRSAPAGTIITCSVTPLPNAYMRLLSYNNVITNNKDNSSYNTNFATGTTTANIPVGANGEFDLRIGQWPTISGGKPVFYPNTTVSATFPGSPSQSQTLTWVNKIFAG